MKFFLLSCLATFVASGFASGEPRYTTPVGYVTEHLKSGQFNLIGLTLQSGVLASGVIDASSSSSLTDHEVDFGTLLFAGSTYILELPNGIIQEITAWSGNQVHTPQNIASYVVNGTTSYKIRKAPTISDAFGDTNSVGLQGTDAFDPEEADQIFIPNGSGGFDRYFYSSLSGATGWFNAADFSVGNAVPLIYADGILILRRGGDLPVVFSGQVKIQATTSAVGAGQFNYLGGVYPVGSTLQSTGLGSTVTGTDVFDPALADLIYIPNGSGGYNRYFYSNAEGATGWFNAADFSDANSTTVTSGIILLRRNGATNVTLNPPAGYADLKE